MNLTPLDQVPDTGTTFADRIKLLIQRVGSATEIARMCGFSEGVVRSWRDGNTDPSRARCVTLARTLGISLVWLVAGEGTALPELDPPGSDEQTTTTTITRPLPDAERSANHGQAAGDVAVDGDRLHAAMRILQSELDLADSPLTPADSGDLLVSLYLALGPGGRRLNTDAMLAFNRQLAERIRRAANPTGR
jgi:hypothetical protein